MASTVTLNSGSVVRHEVYKLSAPSANKRGPACDGYIRMDDGSVTDASIFCRLDDGLV